MTIKTIPASVGFQSLVGVGDATWPDKPLSFGNYFSFYDPTAKWNLGPKCVNMWSENFEAAVNGLGLREVEVTTFHNHPEEPEFSFITDKRIPKEWLIQKHWGMSGEFSEAGICITGCGYLCPETKKELIEFANSLK